MELALTYEQRMIVQSAERFLAQVAAALSVVLGAVTWAVLLLARRLVKHSGTVL